MYCHSHWNSEGGKTTLVNGLLAFVAMKSEISRSEICSSSVKDAGGSRATDVQTISEYITDYLSVFRQTFNMNHVNEHEACFLSTAFSS